MTLAIALDVLVAILLVATIAYAAVLNRRLGRLRSGKADLERLLKSFQEATVRAEASIGALRSYADASHGDVEEQRTTIKAMRDDIDFLVSRAGEQADRLEALIREGRGSERPANGLAALMDELRDAGGAGPTAANDRARDEEPRGPTPPWTRKRTSSEIEGVLR